MSLRERISRAVRGRSEPGSEQRERRLAERERLAARAERPRRRPALSPGAGSAAVRSIAIEMLKLVREMLVIPAQLWMALAEVAGSVVLRAWLQILLPLLTGAWALVRAGYRLALRHVTPARATVVVAVAAIVALVASQWLDYRAVSVGTDNYAGGFETVAPPPEVDNQQAGSAHAWLMVPIAALALAVLAGSLTARPRLARLLIVAGVAVIVISVAVDAPKGLDEGPTAIAYESAEAHLLGGFWLQIVTGSVLVACGLLLPSYLRGEPARRPARGPRGADGSRQPRWRPTRARRAGRRRVEGAST